jgi:hypothetical protein
MRDWDQIPLVIIHDLSIWVACLIIFMMWSCQCCSSLINHSLITSFSVPPPPKSPFCIFIWEKLQCWMQEHSKVTNCFPSGCSISPDVGKIVNTNTVYLKCLKLLTSYEILNRLHEASSQQIWFIVTFRGIKWFDCMHSTMPARQLICFSAPLHFVAWNGHYTPRNHTPLVFSFAHSFEHNMLCEYESYLTEHDIKENQYIIPWWWRCWHLQRTQFELNNFYSSLAVPGHALLWLILVKCKRRVSSLLQVSAVRHTFGWHPMAAQYSTHLVDTRWQQYGTHLVDTRWQPYSTHLVHTRWQP